MTSSGRRAKPATLLTALSFVLLPVGLGWAQEKKAGTIDVITDGKRVSLEYTLTLEDKTTVGSNVGQEPLVYTQGNHEIIPGLERQLVGLKAGESKRIEVSPAEGYGEIDPNRKQEVPKDRVPEEARKVGARLTGQGPDGQLLFARVAEVKENTIVLDLNHPLAGKKLIFDVKVLKIEDGEEKKVDVPPAAAVPAAKPGK
ncbi:MAG: peptidylprolyl isomerase [Candidatus Binatia bacterium]|nr:peptidylprolyl isomerase [Candidatus Binatia bacterium]